MQVVVEVHRGKAVQQRVVLVVQVVVVQETMLVMVYQGHQTLEAVAVVEQVVVQQVAVMAVLE